MPTIHVPITNNFAFSEGESIGLPLAKGDLTIESAQDRISFMRDFDITRDAKGLALAESLATIIANAIDVLKADQLAGTLPAELELIAPVVRDNPFA